MINTKLATFPLSSHLRSAVVQCTSSLQMTRERELMSWTSRHWSSLFIAAQYVRSIPRIRFQHSVLNLNLTNLKNIFFFNLISAKSIDAMFILLAPVISLRNRLLTMFIVYGFLKICCSYLSLLKHRRPE